MSPLTQGRGLKLEYLSRHLLMIASPLTQGRGLKYSMTLGLTQLLSVAPYAGAWIEINKTKNIRMLYTRRPLRRGVD